GEKHDGPASARGRPPAAPRPAARLAAAVRRHPGRVLVLLAVVLVCVMLASLALGRYPIGPADVVGLLASRVTGSLGSLTAQQETLFFNVRLPRVLLAVLVGASLSAAGAAFQGIFQNPLVSPDFLGASQGAALGACVAILAGAGSLAISGAAFVTSLLAVGIVLAVSGRARGNRVLVTVLAGVMVKSLFEAGVSYTKLVADPTNQLQAITFWLLGSFNGAKVADLALAAPPIAVGLLGLMLMRWRLNVLTMPDDEALSMGVDAPRTRAVAVVLCSLVTAASVSVSGLVGWVGLVVPHLARGLVGSDMRHLLPASVLAGAAFTLAVDDIARLATTSEIPIGILTAVVGAPFFLWLIVRQGRR
ncbi:FecCD family ABC transporter permease, partial [Olsenella profusa]